MENGEIVFMLAIAVAVLLWLYLAETRRHAKTKLDRSMQAGLAAQEQELLRSKINRLEQRIADLARFQSVLDTDKEITRMIEAAKQEAAALEAKAKSLYGNAILEAERILAEAKQGLAAAEKEAKSIKDQARVDATSRRKDADAILERAQLDAHAVMERAEQRAQEIAGDAYKALKNAADLEKTVKALKNMIEGYGDQYLIPTFGLLDDLSVEFGHQEAGVELKRARDRSRAMLKLNTAATCDYVEANRKETAVNFVLDAFNGKVDSILAKVKQDNHGTLEQMIRDAYQVVNNNGKAFREARILPGYLDARLDELKWAVITMELKNEEQEEQRRLREQIREEEKARREYEKAIKEAQKEEETLKRLIEKAQKEVQQAGDEKRALMEAKLQELEDRLKTAEEKNQRALSMAQQTKSGNVYIISNIGSFGEDVYKIGMTRRLEPLDRVRELGDASVPFGFDVHALIFSDNAPGLERELHKKFLQLQINKVNPRKEFFRVRLAEIRAGIEGMEINAKWTMAAEAKEYRESMAIEAAMAQDEAIRQEWVTSQLEIEAMDEEAEDIEANA
jgi:hypothetical protein